MFPSDEQRAVLDSPHRITVVHAVPGSGKTAVFVELFLSKAITLAGTKKKIAALSFTTSASKEIEERSKGASNVHFVGTIDSFLLKYLLKPFGTLFGLPKSGVSIIPSPLDEEMRARTVRIGRTAQDDTSIFKIKFSGGTIENPTFTYTKNHVKTQVPAAYVAAVLRAKEAEWQARGRFTHSDCQYFTAKMLSDNRISPIILNILAARFPWVLVDEFQDTGHFLYLSLKQILSHPQIKGLVVGDPDQLIFQFSGADPNNFSDLLSLSGAQRLPVTTSRRCPQNICDLAGVFTNPGTTIVSADPQAIGNIQVITYSRDPNLTEQFVNDLIARVGDLGKTIVVTRRNSDVSRLQGEVASQDYEIKSLAPKSIHRGIYLFKSGKTNEAFKVLTRTISNLIWEEELLSPSDKKDLDWVDWKKKIFTLMIKLEKIVPLESWNQWVARAKAATGEIAQSYGIVKNFSSLFKNDNNGGAQSRALTENIIPILPTVLNDFHFKNVHKAKGTEAPTVIWYIPKQSANHCIFRACFDTNPDLEEMRVAFVAITRSKKNLVILMHQSSYTRLQTYRPNLFASAQVINL